MNNELSKGTRNMTENGGINEEILDSMGDSILIIDRNFKIVFANRTMLQLCSEKKEAVIDQKCYDFSHRCPFPCYKEGTSIICPHVEVFKTGEPISVTHTHIMPDNSEKIFEITASPIRNEKGDVIRMVEILRDMTEKKETEKALKESEMKFRCLVEHSLTGVYLIQDNVFRYVNPQLAKIFGYSPEDLIEKKGPDDLVYPEDRAVVRENIRKRLDGEIESVNYEFRALKKNGEIFYIEVFGTRTFFNGRPAVIGTLMDITERKEAEDKGRIMLDNIMMGIAMISPKMEVIWLNKSIKERFPNIDIQKNHSVISPFIRPLRRRYAITVQL